jgi:hypothetical protein
MLSGVSDGSALIGDQNVQVLTWILAPNITAATIVNVRSLIITARRICLSSNSTPAAVRKERKSRASTARLLSG